MTNEERPATEEPFASEEDERPAVSAGEDFVLFNTAMNNTMTTVGAGHPGVGGLGSEFTTENADYIESGDEEEDGTTR